MSDVLCYLVVVKLLSSQIIYSLHKISIYRSCGLVLIQFNLIHTLGEDISKDMCALF